LLKIGQLKEHPISAEEVQRLLNAAQRNLRDAHLEGLSAETRFDAAYKAIMQSALAALMMHGYRPDTSRPGHHVTVLQSTPLTLGLSSKRVVVFDTLRRLRNVADYTGDDIDDSTAQNCVDEDKRLIEDALAWREAHRPNLIPKGSK
jgi:hypothetical protein